MWNFISCIIQTFCRRQSMNNMTNQPSMNQRSSCNCQQNCNNGYSNNSCNNNRNYNNNLCNSGNSNSALTPTRQSSCALTADKRGLMQNIYELGFVLTEVNLYLDTHPMTLKQLNIMHRLKINTAIIWHSTQIIMDLSINYTFPTTITGCG